MEPGEEAALIKKVQKATKAKKVFVMSAATGEGVREVLEECWRVCDTDKKAEIQAAEDEVDVLAVSGWDAKAADTRARRPSWPKAARTTQKVNKTIKSMKTAAVKNEAAAPAKKLKRGLGKNKQKKTTKASIKKYVPKKMNAEKRRALRGVFLSTRIRGKPRTTQRKSIPVRGSDDCRTALRDRTGRPFGGPMTTVVTGRNSVRRTKASTLSHDSASTCAAFSSSVRGRP